MILDVDETFNVGEDTFFDSVSTSSSFGVTFEDDLTTGYFYAVDTEPDLQVLDSLHIYDVKGVVDKHKQNKLQIWWNNNGDIAFLLINDYCHAIFDFKSRAGYSRNAFPDCLSGWNQTENRLLTDEMVGKLIKDENDI